MILQRRSAARGDDLAQATHRFQPHTAIVVGAFPEADLERVGKQSAVARDGAEPLAMLAIDQMLGDEIPSAQRSSEEFRVA